MHQSRIILSLQLYCCLRACYQGYSTVVTWIPNIAAVYLVSGVMGVSTSAVFLDIEKAFDTKHGTLVYYISCLKLTFQPA
jgi:hypothetical protein